MKLARTISSDEYKLIAINAKLKHNTTGKVITTKTKRMWGFETTDGYIEKYDLVMDYTIESLEGSYCVIHPGLERKYQVAIKKAAN